MVFFITSDKKKSPAPHSHVSILIRKFKLKIDSLEKTWKNVKSFTTKYKWIFLEIMAVLEFKMKEGRNYSKE